MMLYKNFQVWKLSYNGSDKRYSHKPVLMKYLHYLLFTSLITSTLTQISIYTRRSPKIQFNHHKRTIHNLQLWTTQRIEVTNYREREAKQPCLSFKTVVTSKLYQASPDLICSENLEWRWFLITLMLNFLSCKSHQNSTYTICNHYFSAITVHLWGVSCLSFP